MESQGKDQQVDIEKLSIEQADALSVQIGQAIAQIMDEANSKCNAVLNIYGMQTQIHYKLVKLGENPKKQRKNKKTPKS